MANDKNGTPASTPPAENLVMMDVNVLAATIAQAVAAAMQQTQGGNAELGKTIGDAVASGIAQTTRRKVTNGEYEQRGPRNSYHPKSKAETPILKREFWQNDTMVNGQNLFDREVELVNRITHSGRYYDRLVEVITSEDAVHIRYNNKTQEQKFTLKNHFQGMVMLLEHVVKIQEAEDREAKETAEFQLAERKLREAAKERHFGNAKGTREAIEKAAQ